MLLLTERRRMRLDLYLVTVTHRGLLLRSTVRVVVVVVVTIFVHGRLLL